MRKLLFALMLVLATSAVAQEGLDDFIELLRADFKTQKVAIITEVMEFTEEESAVFWPLYREYELERDGLMDARLQLIKDYAAAWEMMTDESADKIYQRAVKIREKETKLNNKYYKKIKKETSAITAVKFMQVMNQIDLLVRLQINAELPLVEKADS